MATDADDDDDNQQQVETIDSYTFHSKIVLTQTTALKGYKRNIQLIIYY